MIQIPIYIQGAGSISAQKTWDKKIIAEGFIAHEGNRWVCQEPDYSDWIDSRAIRRMSRVLQQCNIAAQLAMKECNLECPEAIIVGSAMGCLEDTWSFLSKMVHHQEEMLSPTAFIHSTHRQMNEIKSVKIPYRLVIDGCIPTQIPILTLARMAYTQEYIQYIRCNKQHIYPCTTLS